MAGRETASPRGSAFAVSVVPRSAEPVTSRGWIGCTPWPDPSGSRARQSFREGALQRHKLHNGWRGLAGMKRTLTSVSKRPPRVGRVPPCPGSGWGTGTVSLQRGHEATPHDAPLRARCGTDNLSCSPDARPQNSCRCNPAKKGRRALYQRPDLGTEFAQQEIGHVVAHADHLSPAVIALVVASRGALGFGLGPSRI